MKPQMGCIVRLGGWLEEKHPLHSVIASDAWRMHVLHKTLLHCSTFVNMLYRQATSAIAQALVRLLA